MRLLCALGLFLALLHVTTCLLIGAFNIRTFGVTKSGIKESKTHKEEYEEAMKTITEIVRRYDIILIQELRDPDGKVTDKLLALVNIKGSPQFRNISSVYLPVPQSSHKRAKRAKHAKRAKDGKHTKRAKDGKHAKRAKDGKHAKRAKDGKDDKREGHKERYLFLYRDQTVTVEDSFQYDEGKRGGFDRPPFVVKFRSKETDVEFVLIPIHTSPLTAAEAAKEGKNSTVEELNALVDVVAAAKLKWKNNKNIMVLGDFNAGSRYVKVNKRNNKGDWDDIRLFTNKDFHWLIDDRVATTMADSIQAHDRIVVTTEMNKVVVKDSAKVFDFKTYYGLTQAQAKNISDHFPVEVRLKPQVEPAGKAIKRPHSDGP